MACNGIAVKDLADAGSRAASLALLQFVPLLLGSRMHLVADLLSLRLEILLRVHRTVSWMTALQSGIHIIILSQTQGISWREVKDHQGILASNENECSLDLMECDAD
jgi:hypothetical protein